MKNELPVYQHNNMVKGYEIALAANMVFDLRNERAIESAKAIADLLARNPDPMQDRVSSALTDAAEIHDSYTEIFDGLVEAAAVLMPARHVFDDSEIVFSATSRYAGPPGL